MILYFDFDGTIANTAPAVVQAMQGAFRTHNLPVPLQARIVNAMGLALPSMVEGLAGKPLPPQKVAEIIQTYRALYAELPAAMITLFPGMKTLLERAHAHDMTMAIVTSKKTDALQRNLADLGIAGLFSTLVGSDMTARHKPEPDPVEEAQAQLGFPAGPELVIGDSGYDMMMGRSAQLPTCGVTWGSQNASALRQAGADYVATTPEELWDVIEAQAATPAASAPRSGTPG
ncbi:HAD family hydrolase [Formicincola oecophyllae]|uniref:HAD family hydrolase n=1 Tax=Formicincola oecophyllae TaxID=2558361 RepID=A0A4Y6UC45_9PROT|nr:HAD family hydrolase [Formicincola oecophyllae]QDH14027.1 HAD family hydrolase [Formicincola oecophyllae]